VANILSKLFYNCLPNILTEYDIEANN